MGIRFSTRGARAQRCSAALIRGFCFDSQRPLELTPEQWTARSSLVLRAGGSLRIENGETFAHGSDAAPRFEIYSVLPS